MKDNAGAGRFTRPRIKGIPDDQRVKERGIETDLESTAFEQIVGRALGIPESEWPDDNGPRGLSCFVVRINRKKQKLKSFLIMHENGEYIILKPKKSKFCHIYVVGRGSIRKGFRILGWISRESFEAHKEQRDFSPPGKHYGVMDAVHIVWLRPMAELIELLGGPVQSKEPEKPKQPEQLAMF